MIFTNRKNKSINLAIGHGPGPPGSTLTEQAMMRSAEIPVTGPQPDGTRLLSSTIGWLLHKK